MIEDKKEHYERERFLRREAWSVAWLVEHNADRARSYILGDDPDQDEADGAGDEAEQFLMLDRWFSDRRSLDQVLGRHKEEG